MPSKHFKPSQFFVLLNEELGFIAWFWFPGLSPEALIAWWRSVEAAAPGSAPLFFNPRNLPGRLVRADFEIWSQLCQTGFYWYAHAHWEDDSYLLPPGGPAVYHRGYPSPPEPPSEAAEEQEEDQATQDRSGAYDRAQGGGVGVGDDLPLRLIKPSIGE